MNSTSKTTRAESPLLTSQESANFLRVSERTLWSIVQSGLIPQVKIRSRVFYQVSDLEAYVVSHTQVIKIEVD